jgi:GR25 family glycosyltransferase involved in LPS biosynthesis
MVIVTYIIYAVIIILLLVLLAYLTVSLSSQSVPTMEPFPEIETVTFKNNNGISGSQSDKEELISNITLNQETQPPISHVNFPFPTFIINLDRKPERFIYVKDQLDKMGITGYQRISGVDGFQLTRDELVKYGSTYELTERRGIAGCAASHIKVWRYIAEKKLGWCLILEDDAHFHPKFLELFRKYWTSVPKSARIIFPGYCVGEEVERAPKLIIERGVMCLQGYMLSWEGAQHLIDNVIPINDPIDIVIDNYFKKKGGSFIFNGNAIVNGIRPNDYKEANGRRCMFNGIIYQNHEEQGSTIHSPETVF